VLSFDRHASALAWCIPAAVTLLDGEIDHCRQLSTGVVQLTRLRRCWLQNPAFGIPPPVFNKALIVADIESKPLSCVGLFKAYGA